MQVKALACELPHRTGLPLARFSVADLRQQVLNQGWVAQISGATIRRWLSQDAIRPWRYRSWIFPRDPQFLERAAPIPDLYQGCGKDNPWVPRIVSFPRTKSRAFKRAVGNILRLLPALPVRLASRVQRPQARWPSIVPLHTPNHASLRRGGLNPGKIRHRNSEPEY